MRMFHLLVLCLCILGGSIGCKKSDDGLKVYNIASTSEVKGMDPIYAGDLYSSEEVGRVYEGLLEYHYLKRPYTLVPNLAQEMPQVSRDGLTYTFKIKKGVLFQDNECFQNGKGRELVAEDFVYSLKRLADPKLQSLGWWLLDGRIAGLNEWRDKHANLDVVNYDEVVEGIKAIDSHTVQFKLVKPYPQFLYALAMPFTFVVAKEAVEYYKKEFLNHPVGTGPFQLSVFTQSNTIVYFKNPTFRDKFFPSDVDFTLANSELSKDAGKKLPLVDKIVVNIMIESQPRWLVFQKGDLDYISIPKDNFDTAVTPNKELAPDLLAKGIRLEITPQLDVTYIAFNHDLPIFKNVRLRRALSLAYDVNKSNTLFYNDTALPAQSVVPPGIAGHIPNFVNGFRGPDIELAKKELQEAGYPDGKGLPEITYDITASTVSMQMADFFKARMAEVGVNIKVRTNSWPELENRIQNRTVMMWGIAWGADYPDAENFLQLLYGANKTPGPNGSGYSNPEFDRMYKEASVMQDSPERTAIYENMNKLIASEMPWIFGVHRQQFSLKQSWLKNFIPSDFTTGRCQYVNIDKSEKENLVKSKF